MTFGSPGGTINLMKKKFALLITSFIFTPILLFFAIIFFSFLGYQKGDLDNHQEVKGVSYAAVPGDFLINPAVFPMDARVEVIRSFFAKYKSELEPYSQNIIDAADKYGLDYRLLPSIAMQESNLCKKAPKDSYNCWGFGIYGKKITRFKSFPQAIDIVTKTLAKDYKSKGLETPEEIVKLYTPSSKGTWQNSVNYFINQLQ